VRAYKVLREGRSEFTGWRWPLPSGEQPGEWVRATGPLELCVRGIHACTADQLPQWLGSEIWEVELGGEIVPQGPAVLASQARLLQRLERWDADAQSRFALDCAQRARAVIARYPAGEELFSAKIEPFSKRGMAAAVGYWTALAAGECATGRRGGPDYDRVFARERARQAEWLKRELQLLS
jgi:hypothetical protein